MLYPYFSFFSCEESNKLFFFQKQLLCVCVFNGSTVCMEANNLTVITARALMIQ